MASPRVMVVAAGSVSCIYEVLCMPCLRIRILYTRCHRLRLQDPPIAAHVSSIDPGKPQPLLR